MGADLGSIDLGAGLLMRPAVGADDEFLFGVFVDAQPPVMQQLPEMINRMQFRAQRQAYTEQYADQDYRRWIIEEQGIRVGRYLELRAADRIHMVDLSLLSSCRGRGLGSEIFRFLMHKTRDLGLSLELSVLRTNRAVELYRRLGFEVIAENETHLGMEWRP